MGTHVLVISCPAGVGKSSVAHEISLQLQAAKIDHALIDTDELDRMFPSHLTCRADHGAEPCRRLGDLPTARRTAVNPRGWPAGSAGGG